MVCAGVGLFKGDTAGNFNPDSGMSRAELATLLWRLSGAPEGARQSSFQDVDSDDWYADAVLWASDAAS